MSSPADPVPPLALSFDSRLDAVAAAGEAVRAFAVAAGLSPLAAADLELATVEAANNIVIHGFARAAGFPVALAAAVRDGEVQVQLCDQGAAIPAEALAALPRWDADKESARGLAIMRACTDRLDYRRLATGNRLLLVKRLTAAADRA